MKQHFAPKCRIIMCLYNGKTSSSACLPLLFSKRLPILVFILLRFGTHKVPRATSRRWKRPKKSEKKKVEKGKNKKARAKGSSLTLSFPTEPGPLRHSFTLFAYSTLPFLNTTNSIKETSLKDLSGCEQEEKESQQEIGWHSSKVVLSLYKLKSLNVKSKVSLISE